MSRYDVPSTSGSTVVAPPREAAIDPGELQRRDGQLQRTGARRGIGMDGEENALAHPSTAALDLLGDRRHDAALAVGEIGVLAWIPPQIEKLHRARRREPRVQGHDRLESVGPVGGEVWSPVAEWDQASRGGSARPASSGRSERPSAGPDSSPAASREWG